MIIDHMEAKIYEDICKNDGIMAKFIGKELSVDRKTINKYLYKSALMRNLCYKDPDNRWHGLIRQTRPHIGLSDFCGYYSTVKEFLSISEKDWLNMLEEGCLRVGRNLNDTRGLYHSFLDCHKTMVSLFDDLLDTSYDDWEICFELRINRSRYIRIFTDVLVITEDKVFSLEFKMKDRIVEEEVLQAVKYAPYLEVIFGSSYDVISSLVLTKASDIYTYVALPGSTAELPVTSGDMLFNLFDEYLHFLKE